MKDLTGQPFDLLPVVIAGDLLRARPVEFIYEEKTGLPSAGIKYHSTCPKCSQLVEFSPDQVMINPDPAKATEYYVQGCEKCPVPAGCIPADGTDPEPTVDESELGDIVDFNAFKAKADSTPFVDPIVAGRLVLDGAEPVNG